MLTQNLSTNVEEINKSDDCDMDNEDKVTQKWKALLSRVILQPSEVTHMSKLKCRVTR